MQLLRPRLYCPRDHSLPESPRPAFLPPADSVLLCSLYPLPLSNSSSIIINSEQAPNGDSTSTAANHNKGKAPARGSITAEATLAGEEEAWVTSELGEEQQARYRFALSVLRGPDTDGADVQRTPSKDKGRAEETTPSRRKGKRKRDSEAGDLAGGEGHPGARLRDAIAGAEWKIDQLRSSAHTLSQLDAISARYMQAISLRLGDALKDITSDVPGSGPAAVTDVGGSGSQSGSLGALLRGARITNAAAAAGTLSIPEHNGFLSGADPGQDLLRSFVTASGGSALGRTAHPLPSTPSKQSGFKTPRSFRSRPARTPTWSSLSLHPEWAGIQSPLPLLNWPDTQETQPLGSPIIAAPPIRGHG
ncbi:hypothetical protein V8E36_003295 [Tilletia maclaganii]